MSSEAMRVLYLFLLLILAIGAGIYLLFILPSVPGAVEERLGVLEPLPEDLNVWKIDDDSPDGKRAREQGEIREVRTLFEEERARLVRQVRYRRAVSDEIVRVEPEQIVKRRRVKPG